MNWVNLQTKSLLTSCQSCLICDIRASEKTKMTSSRASVSKKTNATSRWWRNCHSSNQPRQFNWRFSHAIWTPSSVRMGKRAPLLLSRAPSLSAHSHHSISFVALPLRNGASKTINSSFTSLISKKMWLTSAKKPLKSYVSWRHLARDQKSKIRKRSPLKSLRKGRMLRRKTHMQSSTLVEPRIIMFSSELLQIRQHSTTTTLPQILQHSTTTS